MFNEASTNYHRSCYNIYNIYNTERCLSLGIETILTVLIAFYAKVSKTMSFC